MRSQFFHHLTLSCIGVCLSGLASASVIYIVKKGDCLSGKNGSFNKIHKLNLGIKNPNLIYPGQNLIIPQAASLATPLATFERTQYNPDPTPTAATATPTPPLTEMIRRPASEVEPKAVTATRLEITPYYTFSAFNATSKTLGSSAGLASNTDTGIDLSYTYPWNENFKPFIHFKVGNLSFQGPSAGNAPPSSLWMSTLGLGSHLSLFHFLHLTFIADYQQEAFLTAFATGKVAVAATAIPEVGGKLDLDFIQGANLTFGVSGQYLELFQAVTPAYTASQGNSYKGTLYVKQRLGESGSALRIETGFLSRQQNTNSTNQVESDLSLQIGLTLPF